LKPLIYLELTLLINSIKNTVRSPKRLIPMLLIGAWVIAWFVQSLMILMGESPLPAQPDLKTLAGLPIDEIRLVLFALFSVGSIMVMYGAFSSGMMVFTVAHIDFLFPTPISRRKVLLVKLFKDYVKYGFWVAFLFLLVGAPLFGVLRVSIMPWGLASVAGMLALLLLVVNLAHTINIVFTFGFERLKQAGFAIKAILIGVPATALAYGVYHYFSTGQTLESITMALQSPAIEFVFAPAKWCADLFLAPYRHMVGDDWVHLGLLWLMAAASIAILLSRRENVYEPSLGISVNYAKRRHAMQTHDYTDIRVAAMQEKGQKRIRGLAIRPFGLGATAFLWKNVVLRYRLHHNQLIFMALVPLLLVYFANRYMPPELVRHVHYMLLYMVWVMSLAAQGEIRVDLKYANIVKSMPIAPWKVVFAQVASSVMYLFGGLLLFSAYMWLLIPGIDRVLLVASVFAATLMGFATISAVSIPSILYPDTKDQTQNYLCGVFGFLLSTIALGPTLVLGSTLAFFFRLPIVLTLAIVSAANIIIGLAGVSISGTIFRKFDPTGE